MENNPYQPPETKPPHSPINWSLRIMAFALAAAIALATIDAPRWLVVACGACSALAADRTHAALGGLQDPLHPGVLALCRATVTGAGPVGRSVSVCGLAAADPVAASVFAALGVDKLSVTPSAVNLIKATVSEQAPGLRDAVLQALEQATDGAEFREMIAGELILP